jgi:hypothetical protein
LKYGFPPRAYPGVSSELADTTHQGTCDPHGSVRALFLANRPVQELPSSRTIRFKNCPVQEQSGSRTAQFKNNSVQELPSSRTIRSKNPAHGCPLAPTVPWQESGALCTEAVPCAQRQSGALCTEARVQEQPLPPSLSLPPPSLSPARASTRWSACTEARGAAGLGDGLGPWPPLPASRCHLSVLGGRRLAWLDRRRAG